MSSKRTITVILSLFILSLLFTATSCRSKRSTCEANRPSKANKIKKNKSGYNTKYSYKSKPVRKTYVIRNKR